MNKALAISLLVIGNVAAVCAISAVSLFIINRSTDWGNLIFNLVFIPLIGLAAVIALGFASSRLVPVFERKYCLKTRWFILAAYISPIIGAAVYWIVFMSFDAAGNYNSGWSDGIAEGLYAFLLSATALSYLISGAIWSSRKAA